MPDPKHNTTQWDGPKYMHYSTHYARIQFLPGLPTQNTEP